MKYSSYVGRIGALAVALGIGSAIAAPAGIAWADSETASDGPDKSSPAGAHAGTDGTPVTAGPSGVETSPNPTNNQPATGNPSGPTTPVSGGTGTSQTVDPVAPGVTVSSSGGAHTSTYGNKSAADPKPKPATKTRTKPATSTSAQTTRLTKTVDDVATSASTQSAKTPVPTAASAMQLTTAPAVAAPSVMVSPVQAVITSALHNAVGVALSSFLKALERGVAESPLSWMLLAAARREVGVTTTATTEAKATQTSTALTTTAVNAPPTGQAVFGTPNPTTGAITGQLVGTDDQGKKVTFAVTGKPTTGTLVYNSATASFTYTPTTAQRVLAALTTTVDTIAMTVTASDGVNKVALQIDIPIGAIPLAVRTDVPAGGAGAAAATNTRAYVTNRSAGTVTVIDTVTGTVVGTFAAGAEPDGVAVKPDGTRLYVSSSTKNTVTVIDTATGVVKASIVVNAPTAITVSPTGGSVFVTNDVNGTVTRISTSTNKIATVTKLPVGSRPTEVVVSPDSKYVYVTATTSTGASTVLRFAPTSTTATKIAELSGPATGVVVSADNAKIFVSQSDGTVAVIDAKTLAVVKSIQTGGVATGLAVTRDGSTVLVTDDAGRVRAFGVTSGELLSEVSTRPSTTPLSQGPATIISPDGTELYVTDYDAGTVHVVSLTPPNARPTAGIPTTGTPSTSTGATTGTVGVTDPDGDPLSYVVSGAPGKGKVVVNANGTFTYTPTAAARHAASTLNALSSVTTDSFTVTVYDGRRGVVTTTITVAISPINKAPTGTKTVGNPNATGVVTGSVKGKDPDKDALTYTQVSGPTKGVVSVTATGAFTYTPSAEARHAAMKIGATAADKKDTFTVAVADGHGGVVNVVVSVTIKPANAAPTGGGSTAVQTDPRTGVVTGTIPTTDADGDPLTYKVTGPKKGTIVVRPDGTFTYTPTTAARDAASAANASAAAKSEAISITVTDGYGGTAKLTLTVPIEPYPPGNRPPSNGQVVVTSTSSALGTVTGTVKSVDPEGDPLKYTVTGGPTKGIVKLDPLTGAFTYTPSVDARYTALVTPGEDVDKFTVTVSDGLGGVTTTVVSVAVVTPSAIAVDQRPTGIAVHAPDMLFYTQAQINDAFDALQANGIDTVRVLIPWAAIETFPGVYNWAAMDRVVNTAALRGIKVLGVLNSTPLWAAAPNTLPLAGMPKDNAQFAKFAKAVAARYKGKVGSYEVWNEPNGIQFWQPSPNAAQYTELLKAAYTAIKSADPNAVVVAAALGAVVDFGNLAVNPVRFVSEMYAAGAAGYFDALSFHPYLYNQVFSQQGAYPESPLNQAKRIYALMVANGDGDKKIWATEYGQPSSLVSQASQALFMGDFLRTWRNLPFAGPTFIHQLVDTNDASATEASFGLFDTNWIPKLALFTVKLVLAENKLIEAAKNATAL